MPNGFGGNYIVIDQERYLVNVARWLDTSKLNELITIVTGAPPKK